MNRALTTLGAMTIGVLARSANAQQYLMVPDSNNRRVVLIDGFDGHLVNDSFITGIGTGPAPGSTFVKEAIQVGNEIWIADQTADCVWRYTASLSPQLIAPITGFDNVRGMTYTGGFVYITNDGNGGPADENRVYKYTPDGARVSEFVSTDPFDVIAYGTGVMVSGFDNRLVKFDLDGVQTGVFLASPGTPGNVRSPQQIWADLDGNVWIASSIGTATDTGLYKYSAAGERLYVKVLGSTTPKGVGKLGNGLIVFSESPLNNGAIRSLNPDTDDVQTLVSGSQSFQYFNTLDLMQIVVGCQPADIADDQGNPLPSLGINSGVNEGDYNAFFQGFFDALQHCDIADDMGNAPPLGINTGVNEGDYNAFFQFLFLGCP